MFSQQGDVFQALAQRGNLDEDHAQAVVKVFPEPAGLDLIFQVLVGGRQHAHVHLYILVGTHAADLVLLQGPEHLGLGREAHVADLVQEDGSALGLLELALALLDGRGKGSFFVPEQFTFDEFRGDGRTVHFDEGGGCPAAVLVQGAGHQFLARAIGSGYQDPCIGGGHPVDHILYLFNGFRFAHHFIATCGLLLEYLDLGGLLSAVHGIADGDQQAVQIQGFLNKVKGPLLDGFHRIVHVSVPRDHDHLGFALLLEKLFQDLQSVHLRHLDIAENDVVSAGPVFLQSLDPVLGQVHRKLLVFQDFLQGIADAPLVVYNQDVCHVCVFAITKASKKHSVMLSFGRPNFSDNSSGYSFLWDGFG